MSTSMSCLLPAALLALVSGPLLAAGAPAKTSPPKTSPPIPLVIEPATGYWLDPERPGTGFALQRRGAVMGLVAYHFDEEGGSDWHLGSGVLADGVLELELLHFDGGSCLACDPFAPANAEPTGQQLRLEFASAREASLQLGEAEPRRVVALAFGVPYESSVAAPAGLPLPDLRGRWLLDGVGESAAFTLEERLVDDDGIEYRGRSTVASMPNASMRCGAEACELWVDPLPSFAPPPMMVGRFLHGDITEERMTGADGMTFPVQAFRVAASEVQP